MLILSRSLAIFFASTMSIFAADDEPIVTVENAALHSVRALAETENNFSRASMEHGIRASFLQFFADDAIIFAPGPTNGKKFYAKYEGKGRKLMWQPIFATLANSGELGLTTGPWEMQKSAADKTPIAFGQFVSVWKKQRDNSWKVTVDVGIDNPPPPDAPGEVQLFRPNEKLRNGDVDLARTALAKAEATLSDTLKEGVGSAIVASASEDIRVFRDNSFPAVGKTAARLMLGSDNGKMARKNSGGGLSASADLAYRYGSYSSERTNVNERGYFLTIWKLESDQNWRIILDLQKKEPATEKK